MKSKQKRSKKQDSDIFLHLPTGEVLKVGFDSVKAVGKKVSIEEITKVLLEASRKEVFPDPDKNVSTYQ